MLKLKSSKNVLMKAAQGTKRRKKYPKAGGETQGQKETIPEWTEMAQEQVKIIRKQCWFFFTATRIKSIEDSLNRRPVRHALFLHLPGIGMNNFLHQWMTDNVDAVELTKPEFKL